MTTSVADFAIQGSKIIPYLWNQQFRSIKFKLWRNNVHGEPCSLNHIFYRTSTWVVLGVRRRWLQDVVMVMTLFAITPQNYL